MLETKELVKIYKPKKGVPVKALDGITLKLPDSGMVFLLGKSGSGKSTLLNVLGGLDRYNSGEIIINGVSSKKFKQSHFDSYRNTYLGFIFQEYDILEEFTVGANIALAIELQGRRATDDELNNILKQVDLEGYGNRKPNELSGGQKQRVAIARALIKNPQIIMADEPTGALDSNTGKQVLDTLKKLSSKKLVLVVSHDREFAENYADRIIELSDGKIISDVMVQHDSAETTEDMPLAFEGNTITVSAGYHLTEQDRADINNYIDSLEKGVSISVKDRSCNTKFRPTDESAIVSKNNSFKLIKSKLPLKNAFKIGAAGLKYKKFRLAVTIILSCIAFVLFGLADTFGAYDHIKVCTNSIYDTGIDYASVAKSRYIGSKDKGYWRDYGFRVSQSDINEIYKNTGVKMRGVFCPRNMDLSFESQVNPEINLTESNHDIYFKAFTGFAEVSDVILEDMEYKILAGRLPDAQKNEISISEYIFEVFKKAAYSDKKTVKDKNGNDTYVYQEIKSYDDIIGKPIFINNVEYTVTGIVDTNLDLSRYLSLIEKKEYLTTSQQMIDYALYNEFVSSERNSFSGVAMVGEGKLQSFIDADPPIYDITKGYLWLYNDYSSIDPYTLTTLDEIETKDVIWLEGAKGSLSEKEMIVTADLMNIYEDEKTVFDENGNIDYAATFKKLGTYIITGRGFSENKDFDPQDGYKVVGILPADKKYEQYQGTAVVSDEMFNRFCDKEDGIYSYAVGNMPESRTDIKTLVSYCYENHNDVRFPLQNSATYELDMVNSELKQFSKVFLYIGLGFALFAAIMLANFISTSISYKKREIGILRAIGSRSNDVFRIFFSESFIIAMINFVLSSIGVMSVTMLINHLIRNNLGILVTVLTFGVRQIALLLAVSILVAAAASFLPVKRIASKKPIDAIRDR